MNPTPGVRAAFLFALTLFVTGCGDAPTDPVEASDPEPPAPVLESIVPSTLGPGVEAFLTGSGFSPSRTGNRVLIGGDEALVLEASDTTLRVRVASWTCHPAGPVRVEVLSEGMSGATLSHPYEPEDTVVLAPGEHLRFATPEPRCLVFGPSTQISEYLIGIQSTTQISGPRSIVLLRGLAPGAAPPLLARRQAGPGPAAGPRDIGGGARAGAVTLPDLLRHERPRIDAHRAAELAIRALDEQTVRLARPRSPMGTSAGAGTRAGTAAPARSALSPLVGDTMDLRIPDITTTNTCQNGRPLRAEVRHLGTHSAWLVDTANPPGGLTDDDYAFMAGEFDREIFPELVSWFGEPTDLDGNSRISILITQELNRMSGAALGFVSTSDFFACPGGNGGEFLYLRAPDPTGSVTTPSGESLIWPRAQVMRSLPVILAHEVTHIIQMGHRFILPPQAESAQATWLLEGQATLAEEIVGYRYANLAPHSNLGAEVAFGSFAPTDTRWFANPLADLSSYVGLGFDQSGFFRVDGAPEECSWLSVAAPGPCSTGRIAYGVGWTLLRWLTDHHSDGFPGGAREFQRRITDSQSSGFGTLSGALGRPIASLLAPWSATLYADGRVPPGTGTTGFPSWDLREIELAMDATYGHSLLVPSHHLFESFVISSRIAAGSTSYHRLESAFGHSGFSVSARTPSGAPTPSHIQLWVVRLR
jgi:hypothetical protein